MKKHLCIVLAAALSLIGIDSASAGAKYPIQQARAHLEHAHSLLTAKEEGGGGKKGKKGKATIPDIINALNNAEVSLGEAKKSNGTNTNVALKFIADAKTELETAKGGEGDHLEKAEKAVNEALKRVMVVIHR